MRSSLGELYNLHEYTGEFQSSLTKWYNRLIGKCENELNVSDVSRMIRQDILRDVAINRAIDLFLLEPFDGEMQDGGLLALLVACGSEVLVNTRIDLVIAMINNLDNSIKEFDWDNNHNRSLFENNLTVLKMMVLKKMNKQ